MAHALAEYADHVKKVLSNDKSLQRPAYQWCLIKVIEHHPAVKEAVLNISTDKVAARIKAGLVEAIRPMAKEVEQ
jgi:hypothetical protein